MPKSARRPRQRGATYTPAPSAQANILGFSSQSSLGCFAALCLVLCFAPRYLAGFWPTDYDYLPQALFAGVMACLCVVMALRPRQGRPGLVRSPLLYATCGFFGWIALSALGTVYLHDTLIELGRVGTCFVCYCVVRALLLDSAASARPGTMQSQLRWLLLAITVGALLETAPAVYSYLHEHTSGQMGTFYNYNLFANFCALSLPLCLALAVQGLVGERGAERDEPTPLALLAVVLGLLTALMVALALLQTASKGGFLAALCGALAFAIATVHAERARVVAVLKARPIVTLLVIVLLLGGGGAVARKTLLPRLQMARSTEAYSYIFRAYTWHGTFDMARARPLLGFGPGSFTSAYTKYAITGFTRSAHNVWLQIAAENGFLAMLLLAAACLLGCSVAWRALRGPHWPVAAGALGAIVAFAVHGCIDAGWSMTPIALLLCVLLATVDSLAPLQATQTEATASRRQPRSQLRFEWLLCALLLGGSSYMAERAAAGEDARTDAVKYLEGGQASMALQSAQDAVASDPWGVRPWTALANAYEANGLSAASAHGQAIQLSPLNAQMYLLMAQYCERAHQSAGGFYDKAIEADPHDSSTLYARGQYRLAHGDNGGWEDIERIAELQHEPYGLYPATPENVNLDVVRAYLKLAQWALAKRDKASARKQLAGAAGLLATAHANYTQRLQSAQAMKGTGVEVAFPEKLDNFDALYNQLKERAQ